jgi:tRNA pseudouridine55 synthase
VLGADLGRRLGCLAHVRHLRRTRSGPFTLAQARERAVLDREAAVGRIGALLIPGVDALGLPRLQLEGAEARRVSHGGELRMPAALAGQAGPGSRVAALDPEGELLAVLEVRPDGTLHPLRVLGGS